MTVFRPFSARTGKIGGLYFIEMKEAHEERGVVREFYRESAFAEAGLPPLGPWLQVNVTETVQGALRGLHGENMYKLVAVVAGEAFGAYVDVRPDSPTRGCVETLELVAGMQVLVPPGCATDSNRSARARRNISTRSTPNGRRAWRAQR